MRVVRPRSFFVFEKALAWTTFSKCSNSCGSSPAGIFAADRSNFNGLSSELLLFTSSGVVSVEGVGSEVSVRHRGVSAFWSNKGEVEGGVGFSNSSTEGSSNSCTQAKWENSS